MSAIKTYSIGGGVSLFISLIGTGVQYRWPEQKWIGTSLIALGGIGLIVFIVAGIVRKLTIKEYERLHPASMSTSLPAPHINAPITNTNNPVFAPVFAPNFIQSQEQSQKQNIPEKERVSPEIECADWYFVKAFLTGWNRVSDDQSQGRPCLVAQADFHLKAVLGADKWIELRTQLIFYDSKGIERLKRVSDGVWREQGDHIQIPLNTGDTRRLIIAIDMAETGLNSYEYAEQHLGRPRITTQGRITTALAPKIDPLNADTVTAQVLLAGKFMDEVTLNQEFWFRLSQTEQKIEQIESPRGKETDMKMQF